MEDFPNVGDIVKIKGKEIGVVTKADGLWNYEIKTTNGINNATYDEICWLCETEQLKQAIVQLINEKNQN